MLLIFLPLYVNAEEIKFFLIDDEILIENKEKVGRIIQRVGDKQNVKSVLYKGKSYFMKEARIDDSSNLGLRKKIDGIIASRILNIIFKDEEKRYPSLSLVFNSKYYLKT